MMKHYLAGVFLCLICLGFAPRMSGQTLVKSNSEEKKLAAPMDAPALDGWTAPAKIEESAGGEAVEAAPLISLKPPAPEIMPQISSPEPGIIGLLLTGAAGLGCVWRRR